MLSAVISISCGDEGGSTNEETNTQIMENVYERKLQIETFTEQHDAALSYKSWLDATRYAHWMQSAEYAQWIEDSKYAQSLQERKHTKRSISGVSFRAPSSVGGADAYCTVDFLAAFFGGNAAAAAAVCRCESDFPTDTGRAGERGLFQIHPVNWDSDALYDPVTNARFAAKMSNGGSDWSAWTCKP